MHLSSHYYRFSADFNLYLYYLQGNLIASSTNRPVNIPMTSEDEFIEEAADAPAGYRILKIVYIAGLDGTYKLDIWY